MNVVNKTYTKHLLYIKSSSLSIHYIILYPSFADATPITGLHQKQLRSYTKQRDGETAPVKHTVKRRRNDETAQGTHGAHGTPEIRRVRRRPQTAPRWTSRCRRTSRFPWEENGETAKRKTAKRQSWWPGLTGLSPVLI